jgi:hypothetical protein
MPFHECHVGIEALKMPKYHTHGMRNDISRGLWKCGNRRTFAPRKV